MATVYAIDRDGNVTVCRATPENRGRGRCPHVDHQRPGESVTEFKERVEASMVPDAQADGADQGADAEQGASTFDLHSITAVPVEGDVLKTEPYHITDEEAATMMRVTSKAHLLQDWDQGAYIEVDSEPLWSDMDKSYYAQMHGVSKADVNAVLHGQKNVVVESNDPKWPVGRITSMSEDRLPDGVLAATGVAAMNDAAGQLGYEATRRVSVLPYYLRQSTDEGVEHDYTRAYKYLMRTHADEDKQQLAYEALLDNRNAPKPSKTHGFYNASLSDAFTGKSGVFRGELSGRTIPYTGRAVITPNENLAPDEVAIPCAMAVDIFRPTLEHQFAQEGRTRQELDAWVSGFRVPQAEISVGDAAELGRRLADADVRVLMNRQPSLHYASLQSFRPKISMNTAGTGGNASAQIPPIHCKNYGADYDGDTCTFVGINMVSAHKVGMSENELRSAVDQSLDSKLPMNTQVPRHMSEKAITPNKDAMWGLQNLLRMRGGSNG